jgi:hypothetical protein
MVGGNAAFCIPPPLCAIVTAMEQQPPQNPEGPRKIDIEFAPEAAPVEIPVRVAPESTSGFRDLDGYRPGMGRVATFRYDGADALRRIRDMLFKGFAARAGLDPRKLGGAGPQEPFDPSVN